MNILIPHTWLLEHLETEATPLEIQKIVSLSGPSIERIYEREGDKVYDIEVTTNRVDSMSVRGIAREAAVILQQSGIKAKLKPLKLPAPVLGKNAQILKLPKVVSLPKVCKRTTAVVLSNVQRTPTPDWMAKRLRQIEANVHDSVIDITNYVTHELGHPCHAFDYDKIMELGGEIRIVEAKPGKTFTTLDGETYTTKGGEIVFENPEGVIIDLPAIKGTANTAITDQTKNILFWMENLDAKKVRFGSMTHAIRTVAAQLNEKNVDPHLIDPVLNLSVKLYQELCQAEIASQVWDNFPGKATPKPVTVKLNQIETYLGLRLPTRQIVKILEDLECEVDVRKDALTVTPPTFRPDLTIPADIVEEVARIYGYHNLPSTLMTGAIPTQAQSDVNFDLESKIKHFLADIGLQEIYSYSLVSEVIAQQSGYAINEHLKLQNPLTEDRVYLRRSLIPSLQEILAENAQRPDLAVFEIANVYMPVTNKLPEEKMTLSLVSGADYRHVRGVIEALFARLYIVKFEVKSYKKVRGFHTAGRITAWDYQGHPHELGVIGQLKTGQIACELSLVALNQVYRTHPSYRPLPKTMPVVQDYTFNFPPKTHIGEVMAAITHPLVHKISLMTQYEQNYTFTIEYLSSDHNLDAHEVDAARQHIITYVDKRFGGKLVGAL